MDTDDLHVSFGEFTFDTATHELRRSGVRVHLSPKAFDLMRVLIERRPRVVKRQELEDRLWPDTHVTISSLNRVLFEVRSALGEEPSEERFVRTVHRVGYAFVAPVDAAGTAVQADNPVVVLIVGQREHELGNGRHVLGRSRECPVWLDRPGVSREHAALLVTNGKVELEDLQSRNGTLLNGQSVEGRVAVADGDEIGMGTVRALVRLCAPDRSTERWPR